MMPQLFLHYFVSYSTNHDTLSEILFSSPEHEVLMVSYCGQWLSVVRRRASCVVRRATCVVRHPSTFDVYTLETIFVTQF